MNPQHPKIRAAEPDKIIKEGETEHKFWFVKELDETLHTRFALAEIQEIYIRCGISAEFLEKMMQTLIDRALNTKEMDKFRGEVIAVAQNIQGRVNFIAEASAYEELACILTLMDDEPFEYLPEWQNKKKAIWAKDRDFFLLMAFGRLNESKVMSETDIRNAFLAAHEREIQLNLQLKSQGL